MKFFVKKRCLYLKWLAVSHLDSEKSPLALVLTLVLVGLHELVVHKMILVFICVSHNLRGQRHLERLSLCFLLLAQMVMVIRSHEVTTLGAQGFADSSIFWPAQVWSQCFSLDITPLSKWLEEWVETFHNSLENGRGVGISSEPS